MSVRAMGKRLETVSEEIRARGPFTCLCDIGSDHAYLPIRALLNGDAASAVAADLREGPLERGRANAEKAGVSPVFVLSDGFDGLDGFSFDAVSVCGLGGETVADILERGKAFVRKKDCLLFLQPMTAHDDLRKALWETGFSILGETFPVESGRPYVLITARFTGEREPYGYEDLFLGKIRPDTPGFRAYAAKVRAQTEKRMRGRFRTNDDWRLLKLAETLSQDPEKTRGKESEA